MRRWIGKNKQNNSITEANIPWNKVKSELTSLCFDNNGQIIELPNNMEYIQGKTASAPLLGGEVTIESRYIGFNLGNNTIRVRINEKSNNIRIEVIENDSTREKS